MRFKKLNEYGILVEQGVLPDETNSDLADLVHRMDTVSVTIEYHDGSRTIYTRAPLAADSLFDGDDPDDLEPDIDNRGSYVDVTDRQGHTEAERRDIRDAGRGHLLS